MTVIVLAQLTSAFGYWVITLLIEKFRSFANLRCQANRAPDLVEKTR
jgi:hypothetical protein